MTPIRIRGKRPLVQTESSRKSVKTVNSLLNPYRSGKRPNSPASYSSTSPTKLPRRTDSLSEGLGRNASSAAPLEELPTELLETIFLHHPNISLPQASPIIGSKLASDYVKSQLVLSLCSAGRPNTDPCEQAALSPIMADQADAQSALLRMRWMTLTFVRQLIPDYITRVLVRELSERGLQWLGNGPVVTKETKSTIRQYLENNSVRFAKSNQDDLPVFGNISWRIEDPPRLIRLSFGLDDGLVTIEERRIYGVEEFAQHVRPLSAERDQWRIFCGVSGCEIPDKLLHGPWTGERCDFLELVIMGNATVDWVGTTSGEVAEKGLTRALLEGNARAIRLLVTRAGSCDPQGFRGLPCSHDIKDIERIERGPWPKEGLVQAKASYLRGVGVVPQTKRLRTAVLEANCRQDVVETLLMAEDTNIDIGDRVILDWAVERRSLGDKRGAWLLSMLSL